MVAVAPADVAAASGQRVDVEAARQVTALDERDLGGGEVVARAAVATGEVAHRRPVVTTEQDRVAGLPGVRRPHQASGPVGGRADNRRSWTNVGKSPTSNNFVSNAISPRNIAENFSRLYTGKIHISQTGDYVFAINSDDDSYLTVDGKVVASLRGWGFDSYLGGTGDGNTQAASTASSVEVPLHFNAGQEVNFQFWQREGGGGDYADLRWKATNLTGAVEAGGVAPDANLSNVPSSQFRVATGAPAAATTLAAGTVTASSVSLTFTDNSTTSSFVRLKTTRRNRGEVALYRWTMAFFAPRKDSKVRRIRSSRACTST